MLIIWLVISVQYGSVREMCKYKLDWDKGDWSINS